MAPERGVYVPPDQVREDLKRAYTALLESEDIARKLRAAGEPDPEHEAKTKAMREKAERYAEAFGLDLE